jgi:outer membrane beta-barrel protein
MKRIPFLVLFAILFNSAHLKADAVRFPEEELSQESVLPKFDQPEAVKKRVVPFTGRFEVEGFLGFSLSDPFYNSYPVGGALSYHLNEFHSVGFRGAFAISSQAGYVSQIQSLPGGSSIPFDQASAIKYYTLGEYEFTPYYGKISLTKQTVMNLTISGMLFGGFIGMGTESSVTFGMGLNERFFFSRNLGIKADLRAMFYQQTDVVLQPPAKKNMINLFLTIGVVYLFPEM